jgi:hypothetical protein
MSDFLTRLAVRALERPTLVPRLPARFDTQPIELKELHEESVVEQSPPSQSRERPRELPRAMAPESAVSAEPANTSTDKPDRPVNAPAPEAQPVRMSVEQRSRVEEPATIIAPMPLLVEEQRQQVEQPPSPVIASQGKPSSASLPHEPPEASLLHRIEHTLHIDTPEPTRTPTPEVRRARSEPPNNRATSSPRDALTQGDPPPLHVEVTIGRIEISAAPPSTPPVVTPRPPPPQPMGLDEHLRRRRGVPT